MKKTEVEEICDKALYAGGAMNPKDLIRIRETFFKVTQTELGKLLKYRDSSSISNYERGERQTPPEFIYRLLKAI